MTTDITDKERFNALQTIRYAALRLNEPSPLKSIQALGGFLGFVACVVFTHYQVNPVFNEYPIITSVGGLFLGLYVASLLATNKTRRQILYESLAEYEPLNAGAYMQLQYDMNAGKVNAYRVLEFVDAESILIPYFSRFPHKNESEEASFNAFVRKEVFGVRAVED